jgi:putative endonuclease
MSDARRSLGARGEELAARHLRRCGYRILARNARPGGVEIDLVASRGGVLVFVEVKTRRSRRQGPPEAAVDPRKQARIARGAAAWLREQRRHPRRVRFDVIAVTLDARAGWQLAHWQGAFDAGG